MSEIKMAKVGDKNGVEEEAKFGDKHGVVEDKEYTKLTIEEIL